MGFLKNHKIYKKYYPLTTEAQKNEFIENERLSILETFGFRERAVFADRMALDMKYEKHYKPVVSAFGNLKLKNIAHNEYVQNIQSLDKRYLKLDDINSETNELASSFKENETLSLEDANRVLRWMNNEFSFWIGQFITAGVVAVAVTVFCELF